MKTTLLFVPIPTAFPPQFFNAIFDVDRKKVLTHHHDMLAKTTKEAEVVIKKVLGPNSGLPELDSMEDLMLYYFRFKLNEPN